MRILGMCGVDCLKQDLQDFRDWKPLAEKDWLLAIRVFLVLTVLRGGSLGVRVRGRGHSKHSYHSSTFSFFSFGVSSG